MHGLLVQVNESHILMTLGVVPKKNNKSGNRLRNRYLEMGPNRMLRGNDGFPWQPGG